MLNLPDEFRLVIGLGAAEGILDAKSKNRIGGLVAALIFLGGAGLAVLIGFVNAYQASQRYGPAVFMKRLSAPLILGIVLGLVGLWAAWSAYAHWNRKAVVYAQGLAGDEKRRRLV